MKQEEFKFTICSVCNSEQCNIQNEGENEYSLICYSCGFTTTSKTLENSTKGKIVKEGIHQIYKDILVVDKENRIWAPMFVNLSKKGTVMYEKPYGKFVWSAIKNRHRSTFKTLPKNTSKELQYLPDIQSKKFFGNDFLDALLYIDYFHVKENQNKNNKK